MASRSEVREWEKECGQEVKAKGGDKGVLQQEEGMKEGGRKTTV